MNKDSFDMLALSNASAGMLDFGDSAQEVAAAARATVISPIADCGLIRAVGEDAAKFLHSLLTHDIEHLAPGSVRRAGLCSPKGRLLADFLVWREADGWLLQVSADILPGILKKLSMYVLRAKVKLTDASGEYVLLGLSGPDAPALLQEIGITPPSPMQVMEFSGGNVIGLSEHRFQLLIPAAQAPALWQNLSIRTRPVGLAAWHWLDIAAGIPHITLPVQEQFVPQMVNLELIDGVSFKKGCYPGQEIVARTHYLGKIKKRMYRARLAGDAAAGDPLYAPETVDQACGSVVAAAPSPEGGTELLIVLPSSVAEAGDIRLGSREGSRIELLELPYAVD
jgi:hypothetical protein